jgi:hypothetical protein
MKQILICISMLFCFSAVALAGKGVPLIHHPIGSTQGGSTKNPSQLWYIDQDGNVLTMSATPCNYTLILYDEDGDVAYSVFVPVGTTQVVLPGTLSGSFELRFETDTYYYYGYISL